MIHSNWGSKYIILVGTYQLHTRSFRSSWLHTSLHLRRKQETCRHITLLTPKSWLNPYPFQNGSLLSHIYNYIMENCEPSQLMPLDTQQDYPAKEMNQISGGLSWILTTTSMHISTWRHCTSTTHRQNFKNVEGKAKVGREARKQRKTS